MNTASNGTLTTTVETLAQRLQEQAWFLSCAESCTGGLVAAACTDLAGSSQWFERGFVVYSNRSKMECLGVTQESLEEYGAVSEAVALAMAQGAAVASKSQVAVSTSGIAGPGGGTANKPVGMVCFGFVIQDQSFAQTQCFDGSRESIRTQACIYALSTLLAHWV